MQIEEDLIAAEEEEEAEDLGDGEEEEIEVEEIGVEEESDRFLKASFDRVVEEMEREREERQECPEVRLRQEEFEKRRREHYEGEGQLFKMATQMVAETKNAETDEVKTEIASG